MMWAIHHDTEQLQWRQTDAPSLPPTHVRIRTRAAGVNRADLVQRRGAYPPPPGASPLLGLEVSGEIIEVGAEASGWSVGDRVIALLGGGGYAEEVVVDGGHVLPLPTSMSWVEGACLLEVFATAWLNLMDEGGLRGTTGAKVLLHAGASGVGTAAIQLCKALSHQCWVTAGSEAKIERCTAMGADGGSNRHEGPWLPDVQQWAPEGVNMILDPVGQNYFEDNISALALEGTMVSIGLLSGRSATLNLGRLLVKRLRIRGSTLRSRSTAFKTALVSDIRTVLMPKFASGELYPVVDREFPIQSADEAHRYLASNTTFGAIALTVP